MEETYPEQLYDKFFVARQPIFTAQMRLWGYELLFRHGEDIEEAVFADGDQATTQLIADGYNLAVRGMRQGAKVLVNFPRRMLVGEAPYVLPADQCVVEILETVTPEPEVIDACLELKKRGYALALDDFEGGPGFEALCELVDIIKVDVLGKTPEQVRAITRDVKKFNATLLAEKVENYDVFKVCSNLGFTYFQGFFFNRPEIIPGRKLSASQVNKFKLLRELSAPEVDSSRLVEIIQTDLSISYRLLKYINSAFFGLQIRITSIPRAVSMLGCRNLRQWLQVVILSDVNTEDKAQELVRLSVQRARFLQLLAARHPVPFDQDGMFLLGFFSLLDAILDQSMGLVLEGIPLDPAIKRALVDQDDPNAVWIDLLDELDRCNWSRLTRKSEQIGVPITLVNRLAAESSIWATWVMT
ncbi:MAG: HDOD domain-containing protein [Desulfomicrobium sp.]|nr:HDOD domain-containing protein [Pseudomonadota bacterium]MBV1712861.1 HDOD domain-containing protein [Desulfomicrobium sp.]MBU4571831.1 HDOD domain-containing protein [Pseudomonadota bacterium]MBU4595980.1 HDOD domain-containing protein [Pseudomonadota bacterium]MBV1721284.1 HDOD domain-containing protein [Desulfomicrobium sp.]